MTSTVGNATHNNEKEKVAHREGPVAKAIEQQTAKLPSDVFLWLAGASMAGSAVLKGIEILKPQALGKGKSSLSVFVGMWAPTFLILGLYNKLVKVAGSDRVSK